MLQYIHMLTPLVGLHTYIHRLTHESFPTQVRVYTQTECMCASQMVHCTLNMPVYMQCYSQFTSEAHLVHFELHSDWMVSQAVSKLRRLLYHYSNHWSYNSWAVFRLHNAHIIGIIWKSPTLWLDALLVLESTCLYIQSSLRL